MRDYSKCVLCYKCVDACGDQHQNTFAITVAGRGFDAHVSTEYANPLPESACVYCGNCIGVCPTGALMPMLRVRAAPGGEWDESRQTETETICAFCGVGCSLTLHVQDERIVKVSSPADHDVTLGNLCVKGRFGFEHVQPRERDLASAASTRPPRPRRRLSRFLRPAPASDWVHLSYRAARFGDRIGCGRCRGTEPRETTALIGALERAGRTSSRQAAEGPRGRLAAAPPGAPSLVDGAELALRNWLAPGRYRPGDRLPPEHEVAAMLGVSRGTLRSALGRLEESGEIVRRQGSGTFVGRMAVPTAFGERLERLEPYSSVAQRRGLTLTAQDLKIEHRAVGGEAADALGLAPRGGHDDLPHAAGQRLAGGGHVRCRAPVVELPARGDLRAALERGQMVLDVLIDLGVPVTFARTRVMPALLPPANGPASRSASGARRPGWSSRS